jgi:hypothetical protein
MHAAAILLSSQYEYMPLLKYIARAAGTASQQQHSRLVVALAADHGSCRFALLNHSGQEVAGALAPRAMAAETA